MEQVVFWPVAVIALASALMMIFSANAVHSALALIVNFLALAIFYVLLEAHFLAAVQIIIYAGAIMVLFLFVIMLLGVDRHENLIETIKGHRPLAFAFAIALAGVVVAVLRAAFAEQPFAGLAEANAPGNIQALGRILFTDYVWPFQVTALLLIVATIGATVIGRRRPGGATEPDAVPEEEEA